MNKHILPSTLLTISLAACQATYPNGMYANEDTSETGDDSQASSNDGDSSSSESGDDDGDSSGDTGSSSDDDGSETGDGDGGETTTTGDGDGDETTTSGDGDGDGDETTTGGDGDGDGDVEPPAECGNGIVEEGEVCDDGLNLGATEGDCNPTCEVVVERKRIVVSEAGSNGQFGDGSLNPVAFADAHCPTNHKALFAYAELRRATVEPHDGDGQLDWALSPWTEYVNDADERIWTTGDIALLGIDQDEVFVGLEAPISPEGWNAWTGLRGDYTTHPINCSDWTNPDLQGFLAQGVTGVGDSLDHNAFGTDQEFGRGYCFNDYRFFCVEQ